MIVEPVSLCPVFYVSWQLDLFRYFKDLEKRMKNQVDYLWWVSVELRLSLSQLFKAKKCWLNLLCAGVR